jgi:outer membrane protein assembly factor BamB
MAKALCHGRCGLLLVGLLLLPGVTALADWSMAGANPQRTSWTSEEVKGVLRVNWYRPIEAFIQGKVNLVGANGRIYVSTARGLIILNAANGSVEGRFDTQLPLGNSPTISGTYAYLPGMDKTIYKVNALDGSYIDSWPGAKAGLHGNPLVINDSFTDNKETIFATGRDGYLYAIDAETMDLLWQYPAAGQPSLGTIAMSPAYGNGVIYFVSNTTLRMYAVDTSGALQWVSGVMPGMQFQSFWPVVYHDKVFVFAAPAYVYGTDPGVNTVLDINGDPLGHYHVIQGYMMTRGLYNPPPLVSNPTGTWFHGQAVYDGTRATEFLENNPDANDFYWHRHWMRLLITLNASEGTEYSYDADGDGCADYPPIYSHGTRSGNASPIVVGPDDVIYSINYFDHTGASNARMMGWLFGTKFLSSIGARRVAWDEPAILSSGGTVLYRILCCDREAVWADVDGGDGTIWSYNLASQAPGYGIMWFDRRGESGLWGGYGNVNGIYHDHGDQNPLIPYNGKLYVHRSNCIIAYGSGPAVTTPLPLVGMDDDKNDIIPAPTVNDLKQRLESEIQKMVDAGNLRPGYYNKGQAQPTWYRYHFTNPGETMNVLTRAYSHISNPTLKTQLENYLHDQWSEYFYPAMYAEKGWIEGVFREDIDYPPDILASMATKGKALTCNSGWGWTYHQSNFYGMWKYAQIFPAKALEVYNQAKTKVTLPPAASDATILEQPWIIHGYISGYYGFLQLQTLAGRESESVNGWTRTQIQNELNRLMQLRVNGFEKDTPWNNDNKRHWKRYNVARNFMWLTPELGDYMYQNIYGEMKEAMKEYNWVAPYWFVSRYEGDTQEGVMGVLDTCHALFQGKALALKEPYEEVTKYLDAPAFPRGDLFYIDNLITAIETPHAAPDIIPNGGGTYVDPVTVEIELPTAPDANIYYTLDGSEPNSNSTLYTAPFVLNSSTTVKAVAYHDGEPGMIATAAFTIDTGLTNQPPVVDAGQNQEITLPADTVEIEGSYSDETFTFPPTAVTTSWSKVSGTGTVTFGAAASLRTTATFTAAGVYTLRLSANEGGLIGTDDVVISVWPKPNEAPIVDAGLDRQIVLPNNTVSLDGAVTDDGLPDPPVTVSMTWTAVSGPAPVVFGNPYAVDTTAGFSSAGIYLLRLSAYDGQYDANDTVTITVLPPVLPGVVCHLKLNEGTGIVASDSSPCGNNGSINGATWTAGVEAGALSFNGVANAVTVPSAYHFDSPKGTWCLWIKSDGVWGVDGGSGGATVQGSATLINRLGPTGSRSGANLMLSSTGTPSVQIKDSAGTTVSGGGPAVSVTDNTWHHVALTFGQQTGDAVVIYVDGSPSYSTSVSGAWTFAEQNVMIADSTDTWWEEFAGQIDDVQIYNIALSDADMAMLYQNAGKAKKAGDINSSGAVNEVDLGIMAGQWLQTPGSPSADICPPPSGDGAVDMLDLAVLANGWLD